MTLILGDGLTIRQARATDAAALASICLKTGDGGQDATAREDDPTLISLVYALPYPIFEPDYAFVVEAATGVCGYVLGSLDTAAFNTRLARDWYPPLRERLADPGADRAQWTGSDWLRRYIHHPPLELAAALATFPSHGHIDLLPEFQGRGLGRRLLTVLEERLTAAGSAGVHLGFDPRNLGAMRFYDALGYTRLSGPGLAPTDLFVGKRLGV